MLQYIVSTLFSILLTKITIAHEIHIAMSNHKDTKNSILLIKIPNAEIPWNKKRINFVTK